VREGIDGLLADAVEADGLLEGLGVVFRASVDDGDAVHQLAQRDAAAVVADLDGAVGELDLDLAAAAHHEFVDGVIDGLLEQDVDAVLGVGAVPRRPIYMPGRSRMCSRELRVLMLASV